MNWIEILERIGNRPEEQIGMLIGLLLGLVMLGFTIYVMCM